MKKVALVLPVLPHYRVDFINRLGIKLKSDGIQLKIIAGTNISDKEIREIKELDIPYIKTNTFGIDLFGFKIQWQKKLIQEIIKFKPDRVIILYHAGKINYNILLIILNLKNIKYTIWGSGSGDDKNIRNEISALKIRLKWAIKSLLFNKAYNYITYSNYYANKLILQGYNKKKIFIANNTIDVKSIINKVDLKNRPPKKDFYVKFLFVGALTPKKNIIKALRVFSQIKNEKKYRFKFNIVGDGNEYESIKLFISENNLNDIAYLHGSKYGNELSRLFMDSNVFLLPGTGGLAINEAMAYGLPVISTPGDGTGYDNIKDSVNGKLLNFNYSEEELKEAIKFILSISRKRLLEMGEESQKMIYENATLENMVNKFYQSIKS